MSNETVTFGGTRFVVCRVEHPDFLWLEVHFINIGIPTVADRNRIIIGREQEQAEWKQAYRRHVTDPQCEAALRYCEQRGEVERVA